MKFTDLDNTPNIGDSASLFLYPGCFFVESLKDKEKDVLHKIYDERQNKFLVYPTIDGRIQEFFLNRVTQETWVTLKIYTHNLLISGPVRNLKKSPLR